MTLNEIRSMTKETLPPGIVAEVLGCNPQTIRLTARMAPERLGFPTIVMGSRVLIPRQAFLQFMEGKKKEEAVT